MSRRMETCDEFAPSVTVTDDAAIHQWQSICSSHWTWSCCRSRGNQQAGRGAAFIEEPLISACANEPRMNLHPPRLRAFSARSESELQVSNDESDVGSANSLVPLCDGSLTLFLRARIVRAKRTVSSTAMFAPRLHTRVRHDGSAKRVLRQCPLLCRDVI